MVPADASLWGRVLASGGPLTVKDFAHDERTADVARDPMAHIGPVVLFPLGAPGNVRGVLTMGRRSGGQPFSPRATEMMEAFAGQAALALGLAAQRADAEQLTVLEDRDRIARDDGGPLVAGEVSTVAEASTRPDSELSAGILGRPWSPPRTPASAACRPRAAARR